jgi:Fur family ferric uptake transcriptional regulator
MTSAPHAAPVPFRTLEQAAALVRERGLRLTSPRRLVLQALFRAEGPVSAESLAGRLTLDPASVYRNLEVLEGLGLVRHVHLGHGPGLYGLLAGGEHEYLYCEHCGKVTALAPDALDPLRDQIRARFGYEARFTHFPITGACPDCARSRGGESV